MNIARLQNLVLGIVDPDDAKEAIRMLADAKSYGELNEQVTKLKTELKATKKRLEEESEDHIKMENALARARLRAEGERDTALLASAKISEEEYLKRMEMRWNGRDDVPDEALNPMGKMFMKMGKRIKELQAALNEKGKPESQIQAELLADMHRINNQLIWASSDAGVQLTIRNTINDAAIRFKVRNQMQALLEKK